MRLSGRLLLFGTSQVQCQRWNQLNCLQCAAKWMSISARWPIGEQCERETEVETTTTTTTSDFDFSLLAGRPTLASDFLRGSLMSTGKTKEADNGNVLHRFQSRLPPRSQLGLWFCFFSPIWCSSMRISSWKSAVASCNHDDEQNNNNNIHLTQRRWRGPSKRLGAARRRRRWLLQALESSRARKRRRPRRR